WIDICPTKFTSHESRHRALPDRVFDVNDRRHQGNETKIAFNHRKQRANPSTVTGAEHTEVAAAALAQCTDQLPQLDHALTQPFCVANKIGRDCKFAIPIAARDTRIMIGQMKETSIPPKSVEALCAAAMADPSRGHERVQEKYRRRADALCAWKKIRVSDIVRCKLRLD